MTTLTSKFRSQFESKVYKGVAIHDGVIVAYEPRRISYMPLKKFYTPDFLLEGRKGLQIWVETKGRFTSADRTKHLLIQAQRPEFDIRFVFQNSNNKLYKGSKTTYAEWCNQHGFLYADRCIPDSWLNELGVSTRGRA